MSFQMMVHGVLVPICVVLAYKRVLSPYLWSNIIPLYSISAFGMFLTVNGLESPALGLATAGLYFPLFVGCVYGGQWLEDRYGQRNQSGGGTTE